MSNIVNKRHKFTICDGEKEDEDNFHYLVRLLKKLKEIEVTRLMERDMAEQVEKNRKVGLFYGENDYRMP